METYQVQTNLSVQNYANFNLDHRINIQGSRGSGRGIYKSVITQYKGGWLIIKSPNPPHPLDVDLVD